MKKSFKKSWFVFMIICILYSSLTKAQRTDYEITRDTITQWIYYDNVLKKQIYKPVKLSDGSVYSIWQQTFPDSLQRWVQASLYPRGAALDIRYNKHQDFKFFKDNISPLHIYGLQYWMYDASYSKKRKKLDVGGEARNVLSIYANGPFGKYVKILSGNGRNWYAASPPVDLKSYNVGSDIDDFLNEVKNYPAIQQHLNLLNVEEHSIILTPNNQLPFTKVTIGEYLQAFEEFSKSRLTTTDPNYKLPQEYVAQELKKIAVAKERLKNRLAEPVQFTGEEEYYDPTNISNGNKNKAEIYELYQLSAEVLASMKKDKPLWLNITIRRQPGYLTMYDFYQSFCKNFNFEYVYNYFFEPDKVKNIAYTPLYTPLKVLPPRKFSSERSAEWKTAKENKTVIFFEDFSGNTLGGEPVDWYSKLNNGYNSTNFSTIQQAPNEKGPWLNLYSGNTTISNNLNKPLPENFTISFDIKCNDDYAWGSSGVSFYLSDLKDNDEMLNGNFGLENLGKNSNTSMMLKIRPANNNNEGVELSISKPVIGSRNSDTRYYNRKISSFTGQKGSTKAKVVINVKGTALNITVNNEKVLDEKNILPSGVVFSTMSWGALRSMMESNDNIYLSNIKITGDFTYVEKEPAIVKKPGALEPLEEKVNPGKSTLPVVAPSKIPPAYTFNYLPKLKTLKPLVVPVGMKPSVSPVTGNNNSVPTTSTFNFTLPPLSSKLNQLPQLVTKENYTAYLQQLHSSISNAIKSNEKKKADALIKDKKLTQSKDISKTALAAWLQNAPAASLYLHSKAVTTNPSDALAANNFSAFLIMGGLPEKSIPILEYWNKQKPGEATLLGNLGNAYYRLGDVNKAMQYLQQCVQKDTLNPIANKILCLLYLKKGDVKKAEEHATKSIAASYDQEVEKILRQLNKKIKPGEVMTRYHKKEFPLLKRIKMPVMPASLDEMEFFAANLEAEKNSIDNTIAAIEAKMPATDDDANQSLLMAGLRKGISPLQIKAQSIIMDAMDMYQKDAISEADVFQFYLSKITVPHNAKINAIAKKYNQQLSKLEGGEAVDEEKIAALELAKCNDINEENGKYLAELAPLVNEYVQRQEYISRRYYRDYANWAPYWMPQAKGSFLSIQLDYLKDVSNILGQYKLLSKQQCTFNEVVQEKKDFILKEWEDEYCANFKGKIALVVGTITWNCNSWGIEFGEGIVLELEASYNDDGSFNEFTVGGGPGESFHVGGFGAVEIEAGTSIKEFIKIGKNGATGGWEVRDFGMKVDATVEAKLGPLEGEVKIAEISLAVNAGLQVSGGLPEAVLILAR